MTTQANIIRPGILVALRTTLSGGVHYERVDLEDERNKKRWETTRIMSDPTEHERATKVRGRAGSLIRRQCAATNFGLLCREAREDALDEAIAEARKLVQEFNETALYSHIRLSVLKGRVAATDTEAVRAIVGDLGELIERMEKGIAEADPAAIREAANRARTMSSMLDNSQKIRVEDAIAAARKAAREIVKRVEKNGEDAAKVVADISTGSISAARIAFLDMADAVEADADAAPAIQTQRFADLDISDPLDSLDTQEV